MNGLLLSAWLAPNILYAEPRKPILPSEAVAIEQEIARARRILEKDIKPLAAIKDRLEKKMGLLDKDGRAVRSKPSMHIMLKSLSSEEKEKYASVLKAYIRYRKEADSRLNHAIQMTLSAYSIQYPLRPKTGVIQSGPPQPRSSDDIPSFLGKRATWQPVYTKRFLPGEGHAGATGFDGRTVIGLDAFKYPGYLASILYHESQHFDDLIAPDVDLRNLPAVEVRIREREAPLLKSIFGLRDKDIEKHGRMTQRYKKWSPIWERLIKQGFSPYKYSHRGAFPRTGPVPLGPEETETRRLPFEEFEDLDEVRRRASEVDDALEAENRQRRRDQEEAARKDEQAEEARRWLETEAGKCGLEAADVDKGRYAYPDGHFRPEFHFAYPDAEGAKVAFLLARACVQPGIEEPCNDAMGIIERRWSDPEFRESLGLNQENNSDHAACFWWVLDRLKPTGKYRKLRQEASRYYQMQEEERRLEAERWRRRQDESPREPGRNGSDVSYRERRPRLPECMQREGGRCIQWR